MSRLYFQLHRSTEVPYLVFCPIAHGSCPGRKKCLLWTRGRIQNMDSKLLAAKLARFILSHSKSNPSPKLNSDKVSTDLSNQFWKEEGLPNISRLLLIDRYLAEKVQEVEALAGKWIKSSGFHATIQKLERTLTRQNPSLHKPQNKCPQ